MPIDFSIQAQQASFATGNTGSTTASTAASGVLMGRGAVEVPSPESLLADSAEELSFAADTTDDFELEERKERDKIQKSLNERVQLYKDLMHEAGKSRKLEQLVDSLKARSGKEDVLREARRFFPDPSDAWVALADALEELEKDPSAKPGALQGIRDAMDEMSRTEGPAIRAGIQGALSAAGFTDVGGTDEMRDLYRQTVCEFGTVNDVFKFVHEKYGDTGFDRAMDFLFAALSADLSSDAPSMETTHLESVHGNLSQVRLLQSAYRQCDTLLTRWETVHGVSGVRDGSLKPMDLLGDIVGLRDERFLGAVHIERIASKAKSPDIEHEVLFLQELLAMARDFPVRLFDDEQGRMKVLDAVQEAVDQAVEREDAYLAGQE